MPARIDLTGRTFGRLTARAPTDERRDGKIVWLCECSCGKSALVRGVELTRGQTRSCGCWRPRKHGGAASRKSSEYRAWQAAKARCHNPRGRDYPGWGGRGIRVCDEWRDDFAAFLAHIGPKPDSSYSLDRIDNDGDYAPGNVRWASVSEQNANRRTYRRT